MADETNQHDDVLDLTEVQEVEAQPEPQEEAPEEFHLELEGEEAHEETPAIREMRQRLRDQARELDGYRKQAAPKKIDVGTKPTIEGCGWDQDRFDAEYEAWSERKRQNERAETESQEAERVRNEQLRRAETTYRSKAAALPVKNYGEAEAAVIAALSETTQAAMITYLDDAPKIVVALHKYPAMLAKVAAEPDAVRQLMMMKDMEKRIKTDVVRKAPPAPEADTIQRGTVSTAPSNSAKKIEALEKEAARTGNRTPIIEYKRQLKAQENRK